jgi:hypothetical protein
MNKQLSRNNPSFTSPSMNNIPTQNKFTVLGSYSFKKVDKEFYMDKLQSQFKNLDLNRMTSGNDQGKMPKNNYKGKYATHTSITRNWYHKPTPPDIQF